MVVFWTQVVRFLVAETKKWRTDKKYVCDMHLLVEKWHLLQYFHYKCYLMDIFKSKSKGLRQIYFK